MVNCDPSASHRCWGYLQRRFWIAGGDFMTLPMCLTGLFPHPAVRLIWTNQGLVTVLSPILSSPSWTQLNLMVIITPPLMLLKWCPYYQTSSSPPAPQSVSCGDQLKVLHSYSKWLLMGYAVPGAETLWGNTIVIGIWMFLPLWNLLWLGIHMRNKEMQCGRRCYRSSKGSIQFLGLLYQMTSQLGGLC